MITDEKIRILIESSKKINKREPQVGYKEENKHRRCELTLHNDQNLKFNIFIRQSQELIENFSIGLRCKILELQNSITLIRYNGKHSQEKRNEKDHHPHPHIHRITQEEIQFGSLKPQPKKIQITNKYVTFEEGLKAFLIDINVVNWIEYFPEFEQGSFF